MPAKKIEKMSDLECYVVGGAVRDQILGCERTDRDWVVVGADLKTMKMLGFKPIGKHFPVFLHPETHEEYALARREKKVRKGYKGFEVDVSDDVKLEQDLYRRDLTINAMALTAKGKLIDPYGGAADLENGLLRHVSDHFVEDPLRVLRVARFAARYFSRGFVIHVSTLELMRKITQSGELDYLVMERVLQETLEALKETHPSLFFETLRSCHALEPLFPEVSEIYKYASNKSALANLDSLDKAATLTDCVEIRFAVLAYCIRHAVDSKESEATDQVSKGVAAVNQFCLRLKTSSRLRNTALRVANYTGQVQQIRTLSASVSVQLVRSLDGLRNPQAYERFLAASSVVMEAVGTNANEIRDAIDLMRAIRKQMASVDATALAEQYKNHQMEKAMRTAQTKLVRQLFEHKNSNCE